MAGALPFIHGNPTSRVVISRAVRVPQLFCYKSTTCSMVKSSKIDYWTELNSEIDTHLKQAIPVKPPVVVFEPMRHLTFNAPETLAPALCVAACELVGGTRDQAMAAASALRLMYATAFTHENLPLSDRALPISGSIISHKFGPNVELLTGDGLMPFGFELLAKLDDRTQNNSDRVLRVIIEISNAIGSQGYVEGQYNQLQYDHSNGDELWLQHVCKKKDGLLHACAGACGAILGGGSEEEIEKLRRYGLHVGMIHGMYNNMVERNEGGSLEEVNKLRALAIQELKDFNQENVKIIFSLVEDKLCHV